MVMLPEISLGFTMMLIYGGFLNPPGTIKLKRPKLGRVVKYKNQYKLYNNSVRNTRNELTRYWL